MPLAAIGLGANLPSAAGAPAQTLEAALAELASLGQVAAVSSFYRTKPVGYCEQPSFVNAVSLLRTERAPLALLDGLLALERRFGRDRTGAPPKGPRTLDLDLLFYDDLVLATPALTLPHPALHERRFVLAPLAELAPQWQHPRLHRTIAELAVALPPEPGAVVRMNR